MSAALLVARAELRRRWRPLLLLVVLLALISGTAMTALVGAHRTATGLDRLRAQAMASDASFQSQGQFHADAMEAVASELDEVEVVAQRHLVNAFLIDGAISDIAIMSDPDDRYGRTVERPTLIEGRMPDPGASDEIVLNELAAANTGLGVGDRLQVLTWSSADLEALFTSDSFPGFNGPVLDLAVVGVVRTLDELPGELQRTSPYALASASFLAANPDLGSWPPAVFVKLRHGDARIDAVSEAMTAAPIGEGGEVGPEGHYTPATTARTVYVDTVARATDSLAIGLLIVALASALVGAFVVGQAVVRHLAGSSAPAITLRQLGESRQRIAVGVALPIAAAALVAVVVAMAVAVAASPVLPVGLARRVEPDPGVEVDPFVLVGTGLVTIAVVVAFTAAVATREPGRRRRGARSGTLPASIRAATAAGGPPVLLAGLHLAVGRGRNALPNRSALVALVVAVSGVVAAAMIHTSNAQLADTPAQWGWNWSTQPDTFDTEVDAAEVEARLAVDGRLAGVGSYRTGQVVLNDRAMNGFAMAALSGDVGFTRRSGRLPSGPGEVALGARTMELLGVSEGDQVTTTDRRSGLRRELTVVGTAVLPYNESKLLDEGAVLTPDSFDHLVIDAPSSAIVLVYPDDADVGALEDELGADYGFTFTAFSRPIAPGPVSNLGVSGDIATALAWFFAVLAAMSILHTLTVGSQRRRHDLAVLRAVGFTRPDIRRAVLTHGQVLAGTALILGVPGGLVIGRLVWHLLVGEIGALAPPVMPWLVVVVIAPIAIGATTVLAWGPGRAAARRTPAADLRAE